MSCQVVRDESPELEERPPKVLTSWIRRKIVAFPEYISIVQTFPVNVLCRHFHAPNALQLKPDDPRPVVVIFGLMKSGTHALNRYVSDFFECLVEPSGKGQGYVVLGQHFSGWKHHTVCQAGRLPYVLPERSDNRPVVVLLCVREIRS